MGLLDKVKNVLADAVQSVKDFFSGGDSSSSSDSGSSGYDGGGSSPSPHSGSSHSSDYSGYGSSSSPKNAAELQNYSKNRFNEIKSGLDQYRTSGGKGNALYGSQLQREYQRAQSNYDQALSNEGNIYDPYYVDQAKAETASAKQARDKAKEAYDNYRAEQSAPKSSEQLNSNPFSSLFGDWKSSEELNGSSPYDRESAQKAADAANEKGMSRTNYLKTYMTPESNWQESKYLKAEAPDPNKPYEADYQYATPDELKELDKNDYYNPNYIPPKTALQEEYEKAHPNGDETPSYENSFLYNAINNLFGDKGKEKYSVDVPTRAEYAKQYMELVGEGYLNGDILKIKAGDPEFTKWLESAMKNNDVVDQSDIITDFLNVSGLTEDEIGSLSSEDIQAIKQYAVLKQMADFVSEDTKSGLNSFGFSSIKEAREIVDELNDKLKQIGKNLPVHVDEQLEAYYAGKSKLERQAMRVGRTASGFINNLAANLPVAIAKYGQAIGPAFRAATLPMTPSEYYAYRLVTGNDKMFLFTGGEAGEKLTQEQWDAISDEEKQEMHFLGINSVEEFNAKLEKANDTMQKRAEANAESNKIINEDLMEATQKWRDYAAVENYIAQYGVNSAVDKFVLKEIPSAMGMVLDAAINFVFPGAGIPSLFTRSFGDAYVSAVQQGASEGDAVLYAMFDAGKEALTEIIGGDTFTQFAYGSSGLFNEAKEKFISNIPDYLVQRIAIKGIGALEEMSEEEVGLIFDPWVEAILSDKQYGQAVIDAYGEQKAMDYVEAAAGAALLSIAGGGAVDTASAVVNATHAAFDADYKASLPNVDGTTNAENPNGKKAYDPTGQQIADINTRKNMESNPLTRSIYEQARNSGYSESEAFEIARQGHESVSDLPKEAQDKYTQNTDQFYADAEEFNKFSGEFAGTKSGDVVLDQNNKRVGEVTEADDKHITVKFDDGKEETVNLVGNNGLLDPNSELAKTLEGDGKHKTGTIRGAEEAATIIKAQEQRNAREAQKAAEAKTPQQETDSGTSAREPAKAEPQPVKPAPSPMKPASNEGTDAATGTPVRQTPDQARTERADDLLGEADEARGLPNPDSQDLGILSDDELDTRKEQLEQYLDQAEQWGDNTEETQAVQAQLDAINNEIQNRRTSGEERAEKQAPQPPKTTAPANPLVQEERKESGEARAEENAPEAPRNPLVKEETPTTETTQKTETTEENTTSDTERDEADIYVEKHDHYTITQTSDGSYEVSDQDGQVTGTYDNYDDASEAVKNSIKLDKITAEGMGWTLEEYYENTKSDEAESETNQEDNISVRFKTLVESGPKVDGSGLAKTLADSLDSLKNDEPVSALTGEELSDKNKLPSEQIRDFFASFGNSVTRDGFGDVVFDEYGITNALAHKPLNRGKVLTLAAVPDVVKNGKQIAHSDNWKGRRYESYVFAAPVSIDGQTVYVAAVVNVVDGNKFYINEVVDSNGNYVRIKTDSSTQSPDTALSGDTGAVDESVNNSIPQEDDSVKISGKQSAPKRETVPAETIEKALYGQADVGAADYQGTLNEKQVSKLTATQVIQRLQNYARKAGTTIKGLLKYITTDETGEPLVQAQDHTKRLVEENAMAESEDEVDVLGGEDDTRKERTKQSVEEAQEEANEVRRSNLSTLAESIRNAIKSSGLSNYARGIDGICDWILDSGRKRGKMSTTESTQQDYNNFRNIVHKILNDEYHRQNGYDKDINWKKFTIADSLRLLDNALFENADLSNLTEEDFTEINALLERADNIDVGYGDNKHALGDIYTGRISLADILSGDERFNAELYGKIYGEDNFTSEEEWRENPKEESTDDALEGMTELEREEYEDAYWVKNGARDVANTFNQKSNTGTGNGAIVTIMPTGVNGKTNPRLTGTDASRKSIQTYTGKNGINYIIQVGNNMFRHFIDSGISPKIKAVIDQHKQNANNLRQRIAENEARIKALRAAPKLEGENYVSYNGETKSAVISNALLEEKISKYEKQIKAAKNRLAKEEAWLDKVKNGWDKGNGKAETYTLNDFLNDDFISQEEKNSIGYSTYTNPRTGIPDVVYGGFKFNALSNAKSREFAREVIDNVQKGVENGELTEHGYFPRGEASTDVRGAGTVASKGERSGRGRTGERSADSQAQGTKQVNPLVNRRGSETLGNGTQENSGKASGYSTELRAQSERRDNVGVSGSSSISRGTGNPFTGRETQTILNDVQDAFAKSGGNSTDEQRDTFVSELIKKGYSVTQYRKGKTIVVTYGQRTVNAFSSDDTGKTDRLNARTKSNSSFNVYFAQNIGLIQTDSNGNTTIEMKSGLLVRNKTTGEVTLYANNTDTANHELNHDDWALANDSVDNRILSGENIGFFDDIFDEGLQKALNEIGVNYKNLSEYIQSLGYKEDAVNEELFAELTALMYEGSTSEWDGDISISDIAHKLMNNDTWLKLVDEIRGYADSNTGKAIKDTTIKSKQEFSPMSEESIDALLNEENESINGILNSQSYDATDVDNIVGAENAAADEFLNNRQGNLSSESTRTTQDIVNEEDNAAKETLESGEGNLSPDNTGWNEAPVGQENESIENALNEAAENNDKYRPESLKRTLKDKFGKAYDRVKEVASRFDFFKTRSHYNNADLYYKQHGKSYESEQNFRRLQTLTENIDDVMSGKMSFEALKAYASDVKNTQGIGHILNDDILEEIATVTALEKQSDGLNPEDQKVKDYQWAAANTMAHIAARMEMAEKTERARTNLNRLAEESKKSGNKGMLGQALDWYNRMQITGDNGWRMLGNWDANSRNQGYTFAREHNKAIATRISEEAKLKDYFAGINKNSRQFKDFVSGKTKSAVDFDGHKISLMEGIKFVMACDTLRVFATDNHRPEWQRLGALGGFAFEGSNGKPVFVDLKGNNAEKQQWIQDKYEALKAEISQNKAASEYMNAAIEMYYQASKDAEKVHSAVNGYDRHMYDKGYYTDIHYANRQSGNVDFRYAEKDATDVHDTASMQKRSKMNGGYVMIPAMSRSVDAYISQISNYIAFEEFGQKLGVLNDSKSADGSYADTIRKNYGDQYAKWFNNYVKSMTLYREGKKGGLDKALQKARQAMMTGALSFSVSVPIKQVSSFYDTIGMLDPRAVAKVAVTNPLGLKQTGIKNNLFLSREQGISDPDLAELFNENGLLSKFKNSALMKATNIMDTKAVSNVYLACAYDVEMNQLSPEQMYKNGKNLKGGLTPQGQFYVDSKFEEVLLGTQPIFTPQARNEMARTDNQWLRMFQTFRTQQTQNYNRAMQAVMEWKAADGNTKSAAFKKVRQTVTGQLAASVSLAALTAIANGILHKHYKYKDDDDEFDKSKFLKRFGLDFIESFTGNALWMGDIVKYALDKFDISDSREFWGVSSGALGTAWSIGTSAVSLYKDIQEDGWSQKNKVSARYLAGNISTALGMPINNAYSIVNSGYQWYCDMAHIDKKYDDIFLQWAYVDDTQQNRLAKAIQNDNYQKIVDMYDEMGEDKFANAALYGALNLYKDKKIDEAEYTEMLMNYAGKSYKDAAKEVEKNRKLIASGISQYNGIDGRDGRNKFYETYSKDFKSRQAFKDIFSDIKEEKNSGKTGEYYTEWYGQKSKVGANQSAIIDVLNKNIKSGDITYDTAKRLWEDYYGYSTSKWSAWQYVGK